MAETKWRQFYEDESRQYEALRYGGAYGSAFRIAHHDAVSGFIGNSQFNTALDVATGTGQMLPPLLGCSANIIASDLTNGMMKVSKTIFECDGRVEYVQANAFALPFPDESFDLVVSSRFLHLFDEKAQLALMSELHRVLKPGGRLVIDVYNSAPRKLLYPFIAIYRKLKGKRPENDSYHDSAWGVGALSRIGFRDIEFRGVGSYLIAPFLFLPRKACVSLMDYVSRKSIRFSEQILFSAVRK